MKQQSKLACWLLCFALCFCMVLALVPATEAAAACVHVDETVKDGRCDLCQELMAPVQLMQTSASLEGNICVNYFMLLSDEVANDKDAYIQFTMADEEVIQIPVSKSKLIDGYDVFTCEVNAKEMTDIITMQFFYGDGQPALAEDHKYNVRAYAQHVMKNYTDKKTQDLMTAMVNYGAASQIHFDYHTDDLANYDKDGNLMVTVPDYENVHITEFGFTPGQGTQNVKLYSASLILNSETTLRLFFNGRISATYNGKKLDAGQRFGLYYVDIVGIAAKELDDDVTITINDGTESANIVFSPMSYCQIVEQDASGAYDTEMKNLVRALYLYNKAADEYFGDAVTEPQGTNMLSALHYMNGNGTQITTQVNSVTFGRSRDYRNIVKENPGILMDVEQDTPAYVYYILNGEKYDLYFLSNDPIYAPAISTGLFKGMTGLTSLKTDNFDVSRVTNAYQMFMDCTVLSSIDARTWDTSNITDMTAIFYRCRALKEITGIRNWDVSSVKTLYAAFYYVDALEELDLSGWDVSNVTNMKQAISKNAKLTSVNLSGWNIASPCDAQNMLANNPNLTSVNLSGWNIASPCDAQKLLAYNPKLETVNATKMNTAGITNAAYMFDGCSALTQVKGSGNWYMPNVTDLYCFFRSNTSLVTIDVSNWDTGSCTRYHDLFVGCSSLKTITGIGNWDTSSATNMISVFNGCKSLTSVGDLSGWDMRNVIDIGYMFFGCESLTSLDSIYNWKFENLIKATGLFGRCLSLVEMDLSEWDVSKVQTFNKMFSNEDDNAGLAGTMMLQRLNLTGWDTSSATTMVDMFYGCGHLEKLDLSGWNMPNLKSTSHMFTDCYKLAELKLSGWETPSLEIMDGMFNNCESLTSIDVSDLDTENVVEFSQVFEYCYKLERIIGLDKWDTSSGQDFGEMFSYCYKLKELDLSSFDTTNAQDSYVNASNGDINDRFDDFLTDCTSLEKITLGEKFSFDGDGSFTKWTFVMPSATAVKGWDGHWYDADGKAYLPSKVPEEIACTYYAVNPVKP